MGRDSQSEFTTLQYEKFAEWCERAALASLGALVFQQAIVGSRYNVIGVLMGLFATAILYFAAYKLMRNSI